MYSEWTWPAHTRPSEKMENVAMSEARQLFCSYIVWKITDLFLSQQRKTLSSKPLFLLFSAIRRIKHLHMHSNWMRKIGCYRIFDRCDHLLVLFLVVHPPSQPLPNLNGFVPTHLLPHKYTWPGCAPGYFHTQFRLSIPISFLHIFRILFHKARF